MKGPRFLLAWIEQESRRVYAEIEFCGLPVDQERLQAILHELEQAYRLVQSRIESETGLRVDPAKAHDVELAARALGLALPRTPTGRCRCDQDTLADYPALAPISRLRSLQHQLSTARGVQDRAIRGRLWPRYVFHPELARPHTADVAYMAWPNILQAIIPADEGDRFVTADFGAMELRVLAGLSQDGELSASLDEADFHVSTAARMFGKAEEQVSDAERHAAKTLTYAILYGSKASAVAYRLKITPHQAEDFIRRWQQSFPKATAFIRRTRWDALRAGSVQTYHGRARALTHLIRTDRAKAGRLAISHVIQSTAGDLARIGTIHLWPAVRELGGRILGTVHDSFLMTVPQSVPVDQLLQTIREAAITRSEPGFLLRMTVTLGRHWGDRQEEYQL